MTQLGWDEAKNLRNALKHSVNFLAMKDFDWHSVLESTDDRNNYGETRYTAIGYLKDRLHVCIYTERKGLRRIISLRKANARERRLYEEKTQKTRGKQKNRIDE
ncbi:MAG: BrnT family toxin [Alphaproteobacteria bacterium]|nr:BrnT family toxin [Alphaproteobacteria bacterium]